jgi:hypothetical protein
MDFTYEDYFDACNFALNYPDDLRLQGYNEEKDTFDVEFLDKGWYGFTPITYNIRLTGSLVRACIKEKVKKWT